MSTDKAKTKLFLKDPDLPMLLTMFIPIFCDMILNNLLGSIQSYFVAGAGENALSAISLAGQVNQLVCIVFFAATSATMVVVSQLRGIGHERRAKLVVGQTMAFSVMGTAVIAVVFYLFPTEIMGLFFGKMAPEILTHSNTYIKLLGISLPFYCIFQVGCCSSRGFDNHKFPLYISVSGSVVNLICSFVLIKVLNMGILGAGISLIASRVFSAGISLFLLIKNKWIVSFKKCVLLRFKVLKSVLYLGVFSSIQSIIVTYAQTVKTSFLAGLPATHLNASSVYNAVGGLLAVPISVISTMITTLVAKNISKGDLDTAKKYIKKCLLYCFAMTAVIYIIAYFVLPAWVFPAYTKSAETIELANGILLISVIFTPTLSVLVNIFAYAFNGAGDAKFSTIVSVSCMLIFNLGLGYIFTVVLGWGIIGSTLSAHVSSLAKIIIYFFRYKSGKWVKHVLI